MMEKRPLVQETFKMVISTGPECVIDYLHVAKSSFITRLPMSTINRFYNDVMKRGLFNVMDEKYLFKQDNV